MYLINSGGLKLICKTLKEKTEIIDTRQRFEVTELLKTLSTNEKFLIAKYFCKLPWNIGSLHILGILHELRILTATEYILSCENCAETKSEIQLVLNDFLESEFELITNLFVNSTFGNMSLLYFIPVFILDETLDNLFKDLLVQPELNDLRYLTHMKVQIPGDILLKVIHKHLHIVLNLHQSSVSEAYCNFSSWINEGVDDLKFPKHLYENLLSDRIEDSLNYILKLYTSDSFKEWKFYLIMLQMICSGNDERAGPFVRKYLKLRLKQLSSVPCKLSMMHMLLTARAANAITMDVSKNLDYYADWYKNNIGEMKFFLKAEEFQNIIDLLQCCIPYETELDYLEIHAAISISPPVLCGKMVQTYKSKCKQRLQQIKKGFKDAGHINESILVEENN